MESSWIEDRAARRREVIEQSGLLWQTIQTLLEADVQRYKARCEGFPLQVTSARRLGGRFLVELALVGESSWPRRAPSAKLAVVAELATSRAPETVIWTEWESNAPERFQMPVVSLTARECDEQGQLILHCRGQRVTPHEAARMILEPALFGSGQPQRQASEPSAQAVKPAPTPPVLIHHQAQTPPAAETVAQGDAGEAPPARGRAALVLTLAGLALSWLYCASLDSSGPRRPAAGGESGYRGMLWGLSEADVSILEGAPAWGGGAGMAGVRSYAVGLAGYPGVLGYRFGANGLSQIIHMTESIDVAALGDDWDRPFMTAASELRAKHGPANYSNAEWLEDPADSLRRGGLREAVQRGDSMLVAKWSLPRSDILLQMNGDGEAFVLMTLYSRK